MDVSLIATIIGVGVAIVASNIALISWLRADMKAMELRVDTRMDKIESRITQIEHDLIEIKTILRLKECCMISDERQMKKAE